MERVHGRNMARLLGEMGRWEELGVSSWYFAWWSTIVVTGFIGIEGPLGKPVVVCTGTGWVVDMQIFVFELNDPLNKHTKRIRQRKGTRQSSGLHTDLRSCLKRMLCCLELVNSSIVC